jgi:putative PIN family toxin of toxin-antitoxin system
MSDEPRIVLDTNAIISWIIWPNSTAGRAVRLAMETSHVLASEATMTELTDVLSRRKFDPYVTIEERQTFFRLLFGAVDMVSVLPVIRACRDSRDDKFLELAVGGGAGVIVTGDADLLVLHPFRGIEIVTPAAYLSQQR